MDERGGRPSRTIRHGRSRPDAGDPLVEEHLDLVGQVVHQVAARFPSHVDRDELVRAGMLGLVEAARRYDPARAIPFGRFAARRIHGAVLDAVRSADWAPRSLRQRARQVEQTEAELAVRLRRSPTAEETAAHLGVDHVELRRVRDGVVRAAVLGLDVPSADPDRSVVGDQLADEAQLDPGEDLERRELYAYVRSAVAFLPERHRAVIVGYFIEHRSSEDLAATLGVTVSRVSQLRSEALATMRRGIEAQYVEDEPVAPTSRPGVVERRRAAYVASIRAAAAGAGPADDVSDDEFLSIVTSI